MILTPDQRRASRDPAAFALRKLREIRKLCMDQDAAARETVNDIWRIVNFAVYDLNLMNARKRKRKKKK